MHEVTCINETAYEWYRSLGSQLLSSIGISRHRAVSLSRLCIRLRGELSSNSLGIGFRSACSSGSRIWLDRRRGSEHSSEHSASGSAVSFLTPGFAFGSAAGLTYGFTVSSALYPAVGAASGSVGSAAVARHGNKLSKRLSFGSASSSQVGLAYGSAMSSAVDSLGISLPSEYSIQ
jgi:hypothetical protein